MSLNKNNVKKYIFIALILLSAAGVFYIYNAANLPQETKTKTVKLYYYNPELDKDASGNILCSRQGLVWVERQIPVTITPIQDACGFQFG